LTCTDGAGARQVAAKVYGVLEILAKQCPTFGRASAALCIPPLSEKLGDGKLKKAAGDALASFGERTSLQFVLGHGEPPAAAR
jgi:cytoskeleton-associated protein 5